MKIKLTPDKARRLNESIDETTRLIEKLEAKKMFCQQQENEKAETLAKHKAHLEKLLKFRGQGFVEL